MSGAHTWFCPRCERRVPHRAAECHCGLAREQAMAAQTAAHAGAAGGSRSIRVLLWSGVVVAGLSGLAWLGSVSGPQAEARLSEGMEETLRRDAARPPRLPVISDGKDAAHAARPPERTGWGESWEDTPPGVSVDAEAGAWTDESGPFDTTEEITPLLSARLGQIGAEARALAPEAQLFAGACQRASAAAASECSWVAELERGPDGSIASGSEERGDDPAEAVESAVGGVLAGEQARTPASPEECGAVWNGLMSRVRGIKAAMAAAESLAHEERLSRDAWRRILAEKGLMCFWRQP